MAFFYKISLADGLSLLSFDQIGCKRNQILIIKYTSTQALLHNIG